MSEMISTARFALPGTPNSDLIQDLDVAIPEGLPPPHMFRLLAMFVGQRRKSRSGKLFLPAETLDVQNWTHQLVKIVAVGKQVCQGPAYEGYNLSDDEVPKVGDLWLIDPKQPRRFIFKGYTILLINDDQLWTRVEPDQVEHFKFVGLEL